MDFTSDSDVSEGTRDLVRQGLASVKRRRTMTMSQRERPRERTSVIDMDPSQIRHPLRDERVNGASSTRGLNLIEGEIVQDQNHNRNKEKSKKNVDHNFKEEGGVGGQKKCDQCFF